MGKKNKNNGLVLILKIENKIKDCMMESLEEDKKAQGLYKGNKEP